MRFESRVQQTSPPDSDGLFTFHNEMAEPILIHHEKEQKLFFRKSDFLVDWVVSTPS